MAFIRDEEQLQELARKAMGQNVMAPSATAQAAASLGFNRIGQQGETVASRTPSGESVIGGRAPLLADYLRANRQSNMAQKAIQDIEQTGEALKTTRFQATDKGVVGFSKAPTQPKASSDQTPALIATAPSATGTGQIVNYPTVQAPQAQAAQTQAAPPTIYEMKPLQQTTLRLPEQYQQSTASPFQKALAAMQTGTIQPAPTTGQAGILQQFLANQNQGSTGSVGYAQGATAEKPGVTGAIGTGQGLTQAEKEKQGIPEQGVGVVGFAQGATAEKPGVTGTIGGGLTLAEKDKLGLREPDVNAQKAREEARRVEAEAGLLGTQAGRQAYLQSKAKGQSYSQGESLLDAALMGALSGDRLSGLRAKYSGLANLIEGRQAATQDDYNRIQAAVAAAEEGRKQEALAQSKARTEEERTYRQQYQEQKRRVAAYYRLEEYTRAKWAAMDRYRAGEIDKGDYDLAIKNLDRFINEDAEIQQYKSEGWDKTDFGISNYADEDAYVRSQQNKGNK